MSKSIEETQTVQAVNSLAEFIRIIIKEYPLVFKDGSGAVEIGPSEQPNFPYEVLLRIKRKD